MRWTLILGLWLVSSLAWGQQRSRLFSPYRMVSSNGLRCDQRPLTSALSDRPLEGLQKSFYVKGRTLFDPCGSSVVLKGINRMVYFDPIDPDGVISFPQVALTGANCVRIVWQMRDDNSGRPTDTRRLDRIIDNARRNNLIPIVGLWDYVNTDDGGFSHLAEYVAYWTKPNVLDVLKKHQKYLIVNIADEAGNEGENNPTAQNQYADEYKKAVNRLRSAGLLMPLMIDGMDRGKSLHCFAAKGPELLQADPLHNLIFSFHPYWPKSATDAAESGQYICNRFAEVRPLRIVIIMGEIAKYGAVPDGQTSPCADASIVDYEKFIQEANAQNMGWLMWEWGPGNQWRTPGDCSELDMTTDRQYSSLAAITPTDRRYWMHELAISAPYSIKRTAGLTNFIRNRFESCSSPWVSPRRR